MRRIGTALAVRWLQFHAFTAGGTSSVSGWETKIVHAARWGQKKKVKKKRKKEWGGLSKEEGKENNFQEKEELELFQVSVSCFSLHTTGKPMTCVTSLWSYQELVCSDFSLPVPFQKTAWLNSFNQIWYTTYDIQTWSLFNGTV